MSGRYSDYQLILELNSAFVDNIVLATYDIKVRESDIPKYR